jgi:hypothetical protein
VVAQQPGERAVGAHGDAPPILAVANQPLPEGERKELLALAEQMAEPELGLEKRLG